MRSRPTRRWPRRGRGESGQAAGVETLPFGVLVLVAGTLLALHAWAVVDAHAAADAAVRDYLRAYTAAPDAPTGRRDGAEAAAASIAGRHGASARFRVEPPVSTFAACLPATATVEIEVPGLHLPVIGAVGATTVRATGTDRIQPFGEAAADDVGGDPCER